jgi:hypothetical protein
VSKDRLGRQLDVLRHSIFFHYGTQSKDLTSRKGPEARGHTLSVDGGAGHNDTDIWEQQLQLSNSPDNRLLRRKADLWPYACERVMVLDLPGSSSYPHHDLH